MGGRLEVPIGREFNRLTVVAEAEPAVLPCGQRQRRLLCKCSCGNFLVVRLAYLRNGHTRSCGCLSTELTVARSVTHGRARVGKLSSTYRLWQGIKQRAVNGTAAAENYINRGISMYEPWVDDFAAFESWISENLGDCPENQSLDRINNDGNYEPGNLRWATRTEQANNKRTNVLVTLNGETMTVTQWARKLGMSPWALKQRLFKLNWATEKALTTSVRKCARRHTEDSVGVGQC